MSEIAPTLLLLSMLAMMAASAAGPIAAPVEGKPLLEVPLRLIFRPLSQRINVIAILAVLILGSGLLGERWISHGLFLFVIVAMIGILLFPQRYRFTSTGILLNRSTFRTWKEFTGWSASGNVISLRATRRFGSVKLYLTGSDRDQAITVLRGRLPMTHRVASRRAHSS